MKETFITLLNGQKLHKGDLVTISEKKEPHYGWGEARPGAIGVVRDFERDRIIIDFPNDQHWFGHPSDNLIKIVANGGDSLVAAPAPDFQTMTPEEKSAFLREVMGLSLRDKSYFEKLWQLTQTAKENLKPSLQ